MSVLIKGMDMPKNCFKCEFLKRGAFFTWYCPKADLGFDSSEDAKSSRGKDCPLVEVPTPHGPLIDAKNLKNEYPHDTDWNYPVNTNCYVCESIDNAPTVIEAEGTE